MPTLPKWLKKIDTRLKFEILGIILITGGILFIISLWGFNTGPMGIFMAKLLNHSFGVGVIVVPLTMIIIGLRYIVYKCAIVYSVKFWGLFSLYFLALAIIHYLLIPAGQEIIPESLTKGGGFFGGIIMFSLRKLFGLDGAILVLFGLGVCAMLMASTWSLGQTILFAKQKALNSYNNAKEALAAAREPHYEDKPCEKNKVYLSQQEETPSKTFYDQQKEQPFEFLGKNAPAKDTSPKNIIEQEPPVRKSLTLDFSSQEYTLPALSLLKQAPKTSRLLKSPKEIAFNSRLLEQTLESFGVKAKVIDACQGPTITRYELEPAFGVKVSKIVNLADDISLKLAAAGIRIEAPIPGKAAIGIEVPSKQPAGVLLSEVLESAEFKNSSSCLTVALGKDIAGKPVIADLAKMPHLLVAGSTGSGKSVCINTLISSILFKASPIEARFILIDPKMVELANYNGISHLLTPVVTSAKKAAAALNWAVNEMERRYSVFAAAGVRDIFRYNEVNTANFLPLIIIIIDELADLMMVAPTEVEESICRLAQKARACGIHLVLATQRPSVNVITGTIKANIPSRISFAVSSQIDSRTILDMVGAEKLLGKGDMLFYPAGAAKPVRVQGAFISDSEIEDLVFYIKGQCHPPDYTENAEFGSFGESAGGNEKTQEVSIVETNQNQIQDELLEEAVRIVVETEQASIAMLQRRFRIGYTRAARLIDSMEKMKIVSSGLGKREIIMTLEEADFKYFNKST